jgi:23S rRNA (uracil1939-C5)-methyltransferase
MANFFKATSKKQLPKQNINLRINKLDSNGCGIALHQKKPVFIEGALPGESVEVKFIEQKSKYSKAKLITLLATSEQRVEPFCQHYQRCGGCNLQHLSYENQLVFKQDKVQQLLARNDVVSNLPWQSAIASVEKSYRRKARIGVQYNKKGEPIIGFRQRESNQLTAIKQCPVLVNAFTDIFVELKVLLPQLSGKNPIGHIEIISANENVIIVRQLVKLKECDSALWQALSDKCGWQIYMDNGDTVLPLIAATELYYPLANDLNIFFTAQDFIQVNHEINLKMIAQALSWLALTKNDRVLDLFCGLGNFSLPMAKIAQQVVGVEGVSSMVTRAQVNASKNAVDNCQFFQADLNSDWQTQSWAQQKYTKVLLDPARAGAYQAITQLVKFKVDTILYVSCDPSSLAKDSKLLIEHGYEIKKIAIMDMFSQTKHVETMVMFSLK